MRFMGSNKGVGILPKALRPPSRAPPIRCRLCHCRRIKQLMQYQPFSIPPIKGFVQKAFSHIKYSNTYLAHSLQIRATTFLRLLLQGYFFALHAYCPLGETLPTLTPSCPWSAGGRSYVYHVSCPRGTGLLVLVFFPRYYPVDLRSYRTHLRTSEAVPPLLAYLG